MDEDIWPVSQPTIQGSNIRLRPWREDDADAVFGACQDEDIQQWTTVPVPYLAEHARDFVTQRSRSGWSNGTSASFCVAGPNGDVLGACGLVSVDLFNAVGEVGYWIAPGSRGRGLAVDAARLLASWAFRSGGLERLELLIEPENSPSIAAAERLGCTHEGVLRSRAVVRAQRRDMAMFSLLASEFEPTTDGGIPAC